MPDQNPLYTEIAKLRRGLDIIRMLCENFPDGGREVILVIDDRARSTLALEDPNE